MNTHAHLLQAALLAALALASAPAVAAGADAALAPSEGIRVDCKRPALPRQQALHFGLAGLGAFQQCAKSIHIIRQ